MVSIANQPVLQAFFNTESSKRQERKVFASPISELCAEDAIVVDVALNNIVSEDTVLPVEIEHQLMIATNYFYEVSDYKNREEYHRSILVTFDGVSSCIKIFIYDKLENVLSVKKYVVVTPEIGELFVTENLSKTEYLENASRLTQGAVLQYGEELAEAYKVLFHVVFQTEFMLPTDVDAIQSTLTGLLLNTEVTLHLNITSTAKLYGVIDSSNFLKLYIREIGTPDTFWMRTVLLPDLLKRSLNQTL